VKKILFVGVLGGILLVIALWAMGRGNNDAASVASPATTTVLATATAVAPTPPVGTGDTVACARLSDLCSTSDQKVDTGECEKKLGDARKMSGASNVDRSEVCIADAKTCAAASGCISGGIGMGAAGEYLKGLGQALSH
jgi:hypothetical protein